MISEGSCDIEDWSNDAEIQLCHQRNTFCLKYIKISKNIAIIIIFNSIPGEKKYYFHDILKVLYFRTLILYLIY